MLALNNIKVTFNQGTQLENQVLKGINLTVEPGEFITIIGGNGAGKSTLMNVLAGDVAPINGQIILNNQDITRLSTQQRSRLIARVFQDPMVGTFAHLSIKDNLYIAHKRGQKRGFTLTRHLEKSFQEALSVLNMGLEDRLGDSVACLSGGQRQALSLVMATLIACDILLLDEHTAALDPKTAKNILEITQNLITKRQLTTLMITHSMKQAITYGSRTIMLFHGKVLHDLKGKERESLSADDLLAFFEN